MYYINYDTGMDLEKTNERKKINEVEIINEFSEDSLKNVLVLERECFPREWQYEDAEEYYKEILENPENINVFLKHGGKVGGYLLAVPFRKVFEDLKKYDLELKLDKDDDRKIYLETIQILPAFRGIGGAEKLIMKMCEEGRKKRMEKFSIHARKLNGLNEKVKKMFDGKILESRSLEKWHYGGDEPYEYIEALII